MVDVKENAEALAIVEDEKGVYRPDIAVAVDEKNSTFKWTAARHKAAELLATCRYPFADVAGILKMRVSKLRQLMKNDEFVAEIQRLISVTGAANDDNQLQTLKQTVEKLNKELLSRDNLSDLETKDLIRLQNQTMAEIRLIKNMNKGKPEEDTIDKKIIVQIYQSFNAQTGTRLEETEQGQADILKLAKGTDGIYAPSGENEANG